MQKILHKIKNLYWLNLKYNDDIYKKISEFIKKENIKIGLIFGIGALQKARVGYYNQKEKKYIENEINFPVEIVSLIGNISLKDRVPFLHAHISVADSSSKVYGGHLLEGSIVFACECVVIELEGEVLERGFDNITKLFLWQNFQKD